MYLGSKDSNVVQTVFDTKNLNILYGQLKKEQVTQRLLLETWHTQSIINVTKQEQRSLNNCKS